MSSKIVVSGRGEFSSPWLIYEAVYLIPPRVEGRAKVGGDASHGSNRVVAFMVSQYFWPGCMGIFMGIST